MPRLPTPEARAADAEYRRRRREYNRQVYGQCEPPRVYIDGVLVLARTIDPDDYSHPLSDVRLGP